MKWLVASVIATSAAAAPMGDVDKVAVPAGVPTKGLCMIERSLTVAGDARVQLVYTTDGRLLRREQWTVGDSPAQDGWVAYSWANGRLIQAADQRDRVTTYRYDDRGLLAHVETPGKAQDLTWKVTAAKQPLRLVVPALTSERAPIPLALRFAGSVTIETVEGSQRSSEVYAYDAHGTLAPSGCTTDDRGRMKVCTEGKTVTTNRWSGDQLVETTTRTGAQTTRETYTYDGAGRITARAHASSSDGGKRFTIDKRTRYEYLCAGAWVDDPIWP